MTVESTENRKEYAGDGATTAFATTPVVFFDDEDLTVYVVTDATGAADLQTITTDYTVSGGDGVVGTVTMIVAPAVGETLVILRELDILQEADFVNGDNSDAEVAEDALDRATMILQQLNARLERSFVLADSDVSGASTEIPTPEGSALVGWNAAGTALQNYTAETLDEALTTAYTLTLLAAVSAAAARIVLDFPAIAAKGDLIVGTAADTLGAKTVGADGYVLRPSSGATGGVVWAPNASGFTLEGGYLDWSVAASALTVAVKTYAGNNPSDAEPVFISFRSSTVSTGLPVVRKLTAATSLVISSGSTLGTASSVPFRVWITAFDDAGTVRLAAINCLTTVAGAGAGRDVTAVFGLRGWGIASSTAEGGAGAADSAQTFYTGTAATAKAYATLGYATWETGLGTAGTWSAGPTRVQLWGLREPLPGDVLQTQRNDTGATATGSTAIPLDDTIPQSGEGDQYMTQAITPTSAANALTVEHLGQYSAPGGDSLTTVALFQDATANALRASVAYGGSTSLNGDFTVPLNHSLLAATSSATTFKVRAGADTAVATRINGRGAARIMGGVMNSFLEVQEIMA